MYMYMVKDSPTGVLAYFWQLKLQCGVTSVGAGMEHLETNLFQVGLQ